MSQSPRQSVSSRSREAASDRVRRVETEQAVQELLDALDDADCRAILEATSDDGLTANEVAERCDLPLSTTYRKLGLLTDAGLLEEWTRVRSSGTHTREFSRSVEMVVVSVGTPGGVELQVSHRENVGQGRHAGSGQEE